MTAGTHYPYEACYVHLALEVGCCINKYLKNIKYTEKLCFHELLESILQRCEGNY